MPRSCARFARFSIVAAFLLGACATPPPTPPPPPLGDDPVFILGSTVNQNKFDPYITPTCPSDDIDQGTQWRDEEYRQAEDPPLNVFGVLVDTRGARYTGTPTQLTTYRDARLNDYETNTREFWKEASFDTVQVAWEMPARALKMSGVFDDYFNRPYVAASLTTSGLAGSFPVTLDGSASATIHVRDADDRNVDVVFAPNGTFNDIGALVVECQTTFNAVPDVPSTWVDCSDNGGELHLQLTDKKVKEGSFLRVKTGTGLADLGLRGPEESPGESGGAQASLRGLPITFPVNLAGTEMVTLEVRDKNFRTRRYAFTLPAGAVADTTDLANLLLPTLNSEFNWVESFNAGADRLGLQIVNARNGDNAAVRVVGGNGHGAVGLDGPVRVDGVVTENGTNTVRGDRSKIVAEALSLHIAAEAAANGIAVTAANEAQLDTLVESELGNKDSYLVLFIDSMTGIPGRRAGAGSGPYDLSVPGAGAYVYEKQLNAALQIGTGAEGWQTWAHELGHNLGMWDIYSKNYHDAQYNRTFDYLRYWSMMHSHPGGNHADGWHKYKAEWLPPAEVVDIGKPPGGGTTTERMTLIPLEYPASDYAGVGGGDFPRRQLARIELSPEHWLLLENRQQGANYSQNLPGDLEGRVPPIAGGNEGGLLITDTVNPGSDHLYRSAVTTLNPHGVDPMGSVTAYARGVRDSETFDPLTSFPAYAGIEVRVVGTEAGPGGRPQALKVEVERGPGDYLDLRIRPWHSPDVYGTPDIWIDWPGDGEEDYSAMDPPVGNGDDTHWHPDGSVTNKVRVRVHNEGSILAEDVVVRMAVNKPMGMGQDGTFEDFPDDSAPQDIPAGSFADFAFDWNPTSKGHTCLRARILTHNSALGELDLTNNQAQENVNDFHPVAGSPYAPTDFEFTVNSDFDVPIEVELRASGLPPGMKLELEYDWLELAPDEERTVRGRLYVDEAVIPPLHPDRRDCHYRFNVHAFIRTFDYVLPFGGITVTVNPTKASELVFRAVQENENTSGVPVAMVNGELRGDWPANQQVDAVVVSDADGVTYSGHGLTNASGIFSIPVEDLPAGTGRLMLYYFGPNLAPSTLGPMPINH